MEENCVRLKLIKLMMNLFQIMHEPVYKDSLKTQLSDEQEELMVEELLKIIGIYTKSILFKQSEPSQNST